MTIPAAAFVAPPLPKPIDPAQATVGLDRADLLARCGVPSTQVAERSGPKFVETLWYDTTDHDTLEIKLVDNKVASVTRLSQKKPVSAVHL